MENTTDLENVLSEVAEKQNWKNFEVDTNFRHEKGNGFLGEFFMGSVKNKDTGEKLNLAIKRALKDKTQREKLNMRKAYLKEIYFYSNIIPTLKIFLVEKVQQELLNMIGNYYTSVNEECNEMIVMDNLKEQGYNTLGRGDLLDDQLMQLIFKTYGKFHAVSFAFRNQKPEEYAKLVGGLNDQAVENIDAMLNILDELFTGG